MHLPEVSAFLEKWFQRMERPAWTAFLSAFFSGILVHLFCLTNQFINRDGMTGLFESHIRTTSGRLFQVILRELFSGYALPVVNGLLAILAFALIGLLCVQIFRIKTTVFAACVGLAIVAFPSVSNLFSYLHTLDANAIGLLIGVLGMYLADRSSWGWIPGLFCIAVSLGVYQANVCFLGAIAATRGLQLLLSGEKRDREILIILLRYCLVFALSALFYTLSSRLALTLRGEEISSYMGLSQASGMGLSRFPEQCTKAFRHFFRFLFRDTRDMQGLVPLLLHLSLLCLCGILFILRLALKKRSLFQTLFAVVLFLILPIAYHSIDLFNPESVHYLMIHSMVFVYILPLVLLEGMDWETLALRKASLAVPVKNLLTGGALACVLLISWCWSLYANRGYMVLKLKYENTFALLNRAVSLVEAHPDYIPGEPVVFFGDPGKGAYGQSKEKDFSSFYSGMGFGDTGDYSFVDDDKHMQHFIKYFIGVEFQYEDGAEEAIQTHPVAGKMPVFPEAGCIERIDGKLVVKMGNIE